MLNIAESVNYPGRHFLKRTLSSRAGWKGLKNRSLRHPSHINGMQADTRRREVLFCNKKMQNQLRLEHEVLSNVKMYSEECESTDFQREGLGWALILYILYKYVFTVT